MKKQIASLAILLFCAAVVQAEEQISSISFNPSRLGLFEQLRLTEGMNSRGNVTVNDDFYIRKSTTLTATDGVKVNDTIDAQTGRVDIPGTNLQINSGGSPSLEVTGGYAQFLEDSKISSLPTHTWIRSSKMNLGTVTITGGPGMLFDNDAYANGLVLGGNDIPLAPSDCTGNLAWTNRKASNNSTYQVLAATSCPGSTGGGGDDPNPQCQPTGEPETIVCTTASYSQGQMHYRHNTPQSQTWDSVTCKYKWSDGPCCNSVSTDPYNCRSSKTEWLDQGMQERTSDCYALESSASSLSYTPVAGEGCSSPNSNTYVYTNYSCTVPNPNGGCLRCRVRGWYCSKHSI